MSIILTIVASPEKLHDRVVLFCSSISNRLAICKQPREFRFLGFFYIDVGYDARLVHNVLPILYLLPEFTSSSRQRIVSFSQIADLGLDDIEKVNNRLVSTHTLFDNDGNNAGDVSSPFEVNESEGTLKYFSFAYPILHALETGIRNRPTYLTFIMLSFLLSM